MLQLNNLARTGTRALRAHILGEKIPLNVMFSVTNRCTSNCSYCKIPSRNQREMTTEEIFTLIDQICEMGTTRLGLWGGEPLIRNDIGKIIDHAKQRGLFVTLDTNGYLVSDRLKDIRNADHLLVAFDGPEEIHDLNRERGGFKKAIRAFEATKGEMAVWSITVLTKHNVDKIDFILETARRYGFLTTFQVVHHNEKLGKGLEEFMPPQDIYRETILKLIEEKRMGGPIASSFNYLNYLLTWPDFTHPSSDFEKDGLTCLAGRLFCNIDTDGSVYPCPLLIEEVPAKNCIEVSFQGAFEAMGEVGCKSCDGGCCVEYSYLYSFNPRSIFDWICAMYRTRNSLNGRCH